MNTWHLSWHGLRTVTELEVKQRIRSRRWVAALIGWFVLVGGLTALIISFTAFNARNSEGTQNPGPIAFGLIVFLVLGLGLVIAPAFTATSINGDRNAGVLALLQGTRLSALEIALGRLVAAWLTLAVFLLVALPFLAWSMVLGRISVWQVAVCFVVVLLEVAIVAAVGLGWSALFNRTAASTVMTYLTVVMLTIVLPMVMGMLTVLTQTKDQVRTWGLSEADERVYQRQVDEYWSKQDSGPGAAPPPAAPFDRCQWNDGEIERVHPEKVWWLLAVNPFVIVADAAPLPEGAGDNLGRYVSSSGDPLALLKSVVRATSVPPPAEMDECLRLYTYGGGYDVEFDDAGNVVSVKTSNGTPVPITSPVRRAPITANNPIWPWGLGANLLLGAGMFWVAVRRLRVPYGVLTPGTRVA